MSFLMLRPSRVFVADKVGRVGEDEIGAGCGQGRQDLAAVAEDDAIVFHVEFSVAHHRVRKPSRASARVLPRTAAGEAKRITAAAKKKAA